LNAAVKCSDEEMNMTDCVQLTQGVGSMLWGLRAESVSSCGWGLGICDVTTATISKRIVLRHYLWCMGLKKEELVIFFHY